MVTKNYLLKSDGISFNKTYEKFNKEDYKNLQKTTIEKDKMTESELNLFIEKFYPIGD